MINILLFFIADGLAVFNKLPFSTDDIDSASLESLCQLDIQVSLNSLNMPKELAIMIKPIYCLLKSVMY